MEYLCIFFVVWNIVEYSCIFLHIMHIFVAYHQFCVFAEEGEEEIIGADQRISMESFSTGCVRRDQPLAAMDVPIANNLVQDSHDVRKVMGMAGSKDSFVQISSHLDQIMPGREPVPTIRGEPIGRRACLKRKAADITRSTCEAFAFLTTKNFSREDASDLFATFCNVCCTICMGSFSIRVVNLL